MCGKDVHIIVGTPEYLSRVAVGGKLRLQNVRGMVVDEADMCLTDPAQAKAMKLLMRRMSEVRKEANVPPPQTLLAGASLTPSLVRRASDDGWLRSPTLVSELGWTDVALEEATNTPVAVASQRVPAGASHEYVVAEPRDAVVTLCRLLRDRFESVNSETDPPRVVVFAPSADAAVELASRLQVKPSLSASPHLLALLTPHSPRSPHSSSPRSPRSGRRARSSARSRATPPPACGG